jgi:hypothetical protein
MEQHPPKFKEYKDDWGTTAREGYEDRGAFRPPRAPRKDPGSSILRTIGAFTIFGGMCWGTYVVTRSGDIVAALQHNYGPLAIIGLGAATSLLGKYLRV